MAAITLQNVFDQVRSTYLNDIQVSGGEIFTNAVLQPAFNEAWRSMWNCLMGPSKTVEKIVYVNLPAYTTVLIPSLYGIDDLFEPEFVEERPGPNLITIVSTTATSPISVNAPNHGLGSANGVIITDVAGTFAPWGAWFVTVTDANNFTLNGSSTDGNVGTGGIATQNSNVPWSDVIPVFRDDQLDGPPGQYLGNYLWRDEQLVFRGCTELQQIRITYQSSGTPPTNPNQALGVLNCIDFLACATAAT